MTCCRLVARPCSILLADGINFVASFHVTGSHPEVLLNAILQQAVLDCYIGGRGKQPQSYIVNCTEGMEITQIL